MPPGKTTRVQLPGFDGGAEWGGPTYDPETGMLYINANEMGWLVTIRDNVMKAPEKENHLQAGTRLYGQYCANCHGIDRKGTGNNPTIIAMGEKYQPGEAMELLNSGRRMMPSFKYLSEENKKAILSYVLDLKNEQVKSFKAAPQAVDTFRNLPYGITGYYKYLSPEGYPAISPPWGTLTAIDLNTGEHVWKTPLGE